MNSIECVELPDNRLDTVARMDIALRIKRAVEDFKPSVVLTHHPGDYNWDHGITFDAVLMACRPNAGDFYPSEIYSFEVPSSTERAFPYGKNIFAPNYFENIGRCIAVKKKALACYRSELRPYPHPRSIKGIEILARKRGLEVGVEFAEAFQLVRGIRS